MELFVLDFSFFFVKVIIAISIAIIFYMSICDNTRVRLGVVRALLIICVFGLALLFGIDVSNIINGVDN